MGLVLLDRNGLKIEFWPGLIVRDSVLEKCKDEVCACGVMGRLGWVWCPRIGTVFVRREECAWKKVWVNCGGIVPCCVLTVTIRGNNYIKQMFLIFNTKEIVCE